MKKITLFAAFALFSVCAFSQSNETKPTLEKKNFKKVEGIKLKDAKPVIKKQDKAAKRKNEAVRKETGIRNSKKK